ncbi:HNH endonuclease [Streptacidiphilus sp. N1-12]|uniref:HNH endonuclease n=2 Tax=Streptacidiphilus alkalitolerans TaxID=3342712 RepID=A0ABV6WDC6_9ACTN
MTREQLLSTLAGLRKAPTPGGARAPHKPLLLLWLLGRLEATGSTVASYREAAGPVGSLIEDYGPWAPSVRHRAVMPFVHLERTLWDLRDGAGRPIPSDLRESHRRLLELEAIGRLRPEAEQLLRDPATLLAAVRLLLEQHFTSTLEEAICARAGLDLPGLEHSLLEAALRGTLAGPATGAASEAEAEAEAEAGPNGEARYRILRRRIRIRDAAFSGRVLSAYGHACAMCGYDGTLRGAPAGIEAAHVRWHSHQGPDEVSNALALCALHHTLLDLGALGLTPERTIRVSRRYAAATPAGAAVTALDGAPLAVPRTLPSGVAPEHIAWHDAQVFKSM